MSEKIQRDYWPTYNWRVSKPADQGMDTEILFNLFKYVESTQEELQSVVIIKNGYIVTEGYYHPFHKDYLRQIYCITKTFMATLVGILIKEGYIKSVDQKVMDFFEGDTVANVSPYKSEMTIKHLIASTTGFDWGDPDNETPADIGMIRNMYSTTLEWGKTSFDQNVIHKPGTLVNFTSAGPQILGLIIKKVTGMNPYQYAKEKLFKPLGITNTMWYTSPVEENPVNHGLRIAPRDIAKLAYLYLNNGYWENDMLLEKGYADEATSIIYESRDCHKRDNIMGHGYQWYMLSGLPYYTYYTFGFLGQAVYVVKELDLICIFSSNIAIDRHKKKTYELFKDYVLASCINFNPAKNHQKIYEEFQAHLFDIEHPKPLQAGNTNKSFFNVTNDVQYHFDQDNEFALIENMFGKFFVKALTFTAIHEKAFKLEVVTREECFNFLVSLDSNFLSTKFTSDYGEVLISARGIFENGNILNIIYTTSCGMRNSFTVSIKNKNQIECDVNNHISQGIKVGTAKPQDIKIAIA